MNHLFLNKRLCFIFDKFTCKTPLFSMPNINFYIIAYGLKKIVCYYNTGVYDKHMGFVACCCYQTSELHQIISYYYDINNLKRYNNFCLNDEEYEIFKNKLNEHCLSKFIVNNQSSIYNIL